MAQGYATGNQQELDNIQDLLGNLSESAFGDVSVAPSTETVIATFTAIASAKVRRVFGEGNCDGIFRLYVNANKVWQGRNAWTQRGINEALDQNIVNGDTVELRVIHQNLVNQNFSGGFYIYEL